MLVSLSHPFCHRPDVQPSQPEQTTEIGLLLCVFVDFCQYTGNVTVFFMRFGIRSQPLDGLLPIYSDITRINVCHQILFHR